MSLAVVSLRGRPARPPQKTFASRLVLAV